jgi:hypothetical protein
MYYERRNRVNEVNEGTPTNGTLQSPNHHWNTRLQASRGYGRKVVARAASHKGE